MEYEENKIMAYPFAGGGAPSSSFPLEDFDLHHISGNLYELTLKDPFYVEQAAGAVTKQYKIPYKFRLLHVIVKHCDANDADNTAAFTWSLSTTLNPTALFFKLIDYVASVVTDFDEDEFADKNYVFDNVIFKFITNTTNLHHVYLKLIVQILER